jgi:hypothetical protein
VCQPASSSRTIDAIAHATATGLARGHVQAIAAATITVRKA